MLQETLLKINFISHQNPEHSMFNVRRLFQRHGLRAGGPGDQGHLPADGLVRAEQGGGKKG